MDVVSKNKKDEKHKKNKHEKSKKSEKKKKRKRSRSSSSSSSERSPKKSKKNKHKKSKKKSKHSDKEVSGPSNVLSKILDKSESEEDYGIPLDLMNTKANAPESKEEYEKRQSQIRRVYDEETGRHRLIKGDGEVIEEIVSRKAHEEINRIATQSDGSTFQNRLGLNK